VTAGVDMLPVISGNATNLLGRVDHLQMFLYLPPFAIYMQQNYERFTIFINKTKQPL
jgi:hypothetical protein